MSIYFSSGCFQSRDMKKIMAICRNNGLNLELGSSLASAPGMRSALANQPFYGHLLVHNYFPPPQAPFVLNLASADPQIHARSLDLCQNAIDLCVDLKAPFYSVHAGFAFDLPAGHLGRPFLQRRGRATSAADREKGFEIFMTTIHRMVNYAAARDIELLVENNVATAEVRDDDGRSPFFLTDIEEITVFFNEMNHPSLGLLMDTGHANVSAAGAGHPPQRYLEELAGHIRCFHLSDNDELADNHQPFAQDAWFAPNLVEFSEIPMVIEVWRQSMSAMQAQRQVLEGILNRTPAATE